jgi:hypothetical protein
MTVRGLRDSSIPVMAVVIASVAAVLAASLAEAGPVRSGPAIACFHPEVGRFTAEAHPSQCNLRGYRGYRGDNGVRELRIKGINWGHWGSNPTRGAYGK